MSVHWPIIRRLVRHPLRQRVVDETRAYRNIELLVASQHVAAEVQRRSGAPRVGVMLPASGAFPIAALGVWTLGRVLVPLNFLLKPEELQYVVDHAELDTIVTATPMLQYLDRPPRVPHMLKLDEMDFRSVPDLRWPASAAEDDLAVILYTSGTSGLPKGVMLTHGNIAANVRQCKQWMSFGPADTILGVLPQFHSYGLTVLTLLTLQAGCRVVYAPRFVPQRIIKLFREHRPTIFVGIPSMYTALLSVKDAQPEDFASLRCAVCGGEPLPRDTFDRFRERFGVTINEGYGLTETAPVSNWCRPGEGRFGTVGRALPGIDQRIVDIDTGRDLPPGREGEIRMRGPNIMPGYYRAPQETAAAFDERGYFRTGDIGMLDAEGFLSITGRLKEMIIVAGENVFPREVEEALNQHPDVNASGVIGVADPVRGEIITAFVEMVEGAEFDEGALKHWCRDRIAGYKVPRHIHRIDALPRNPTGKILRRELRGMLPAQPAGATDPAVGGATDPGSHARA